MSATNASATTTVPTAASRRVRLLGALQTLARAFMLLIAVLPVAALLLRLGHLDLLAGGGGSARRAVRPGGHKGGRLRSRNAGGDQRGGLPGQETEKRHLTSHSRGASTRNQRADRWTLTAYPAPCSPRRNSS